jgi:LytS/YehU family sensor histidine kinase
MLVENSIQHNEASQAMPLQISIYTVNNTLCIENNIQARSDLASSSRTGLKNIQSRFDFFSDNKVEVFNNGKVFKVTLPLIIKQ